MITTDDIIKYMQEHAIVDGVVDVPQDDAMMMLALHDGLADMIDGKWIGRGHISPGETRTVRHSDGTISSVCG